jgi:hypothetical protein
MRQLITFVLILWPENGQDEARCTERDSEKAKRFQWLRQLGLRSELLSALWCRNRDLRPPTARKTIGGPVQICYANLHLPFPKNRRGVLPLISPFSNSKMYSRFVKSGTYKRISNCRECVDYRLESDGWRPGCQGIRLAYASTPVGAAEAPYEIGRN